MNCLARNPWPGNVRELANLLERLAILFPEQTVTAADLPERYRNKGTNGWFASGMRIVPPATAAAASANASPGLLEELLEAGESEFSGTEEPIDTTELADTMEFADAADLVDTPDFAGPGETASGELPRGGFDLKDHLSAIEIGLIRQALEEADGTVAGAARLLRMRRTTLVEKLRKYRLSA
jgi:sigma-54 specific flagellar transcriptional regulator A